MQGEHVAVEEHAGLFHVQQYGHQGLLDIDVHVAQRFDLAELGPEGLVQLQSDVGVFRGVRRSGFEIDNIGPKMVEQLVDAGYVEFPPPRSSTCTASTGPARR